MAWVRQPYARLSERASINGPLSFTQPTDTRIRRSRLRNSEPTNTSSES